MTTMSVAEAKAAFAALLDRVARGERVTVTRRGRPAAVLVPPFEAPGNAPATEGVASLLGCLSVLGIEDAEWDRTMEEVVASRRRERSRPVAL